VNSFVDQISQSILAEMPVYPWYNNAHMIEGHRKLRTGVHCGSLVLRADLRESNQPGGDHVTAMPPPSVDWCPLMPNRPEFPRPIMTSLELGNGQWGILRKLPWSKRSKPWVPPSCQLLTLVRCGHTTRRGQRWGCRGQPGKRGITRSCPFYATKKQKLSRQSEQCTTHPRECKMPAQGSVWYYDPWRSSQRKKIHRKAPPFWRIGYTIAPHFGSCYRLLN